MSYLECYQAIGLKINNPRIRAELENLVRVIPSVCCGPKAGSGVDSRYFDEKQDFTEAVRAPLRLSQQTTWLENPIIVFSIGIWTIGVARTVRQHSVALRH